MPEAIVKIFNPITEHVILIGKPIKETKSEIEIHPVITETKTRTLSIYCRNIFVLFTHQFVSICFSIK